MGRRTTRAAEAASQEASEAARTLAQRSHEARAEKTEDPKVEKVEVRPSPNPDRVEKLLQNRPHEQAYDELLAKREKSEPEEEKKEEPKAEPEAPKEAQPAEPAPVVAEAPPEAPKTVRVKVDGVEEDVAESVVEEYGGVKGYQIAKAAENRLAKAKEITEENRKTQSQLADLAKVLLQQNSPKPEPKVSTEQLIDSKIDVIRFGTKEESRAAFMEVIQALVPKQADPNAIMSQTLAAVQKTQAVEEFRKQFPDIMGNQLLLRLAASLENEEVANAQKSGQPIDWRNLYSRIGNQVRSVVPRQSQPQATQQTAGNPSQAPSDKEARKASITVLPTASARAELPKEEKELTPEEERKAWIAEQKKARGLG